MTTKTLSARALSIIDQYLHFKIGPAECSVPYFNNKTIRARAALAVFVGKGSPKEIRDEANILIHKNHLDVESLTADSLKKILTDNNIGIDCSGFAYQILNAESEERGMGSLKNHLHFDNTGGIIRKMAAALNPMKHADVIAFSYGKNSRIIALQDIRPGDIITMTAGPDGPERNHILIVHQVDYLSSNRVQDQTRDQMASDSTYHHTPIKIYYSHAVAYPEDGMYGSGIKQGTITLNNLDKPIIEAIWFENGMEGAANRIFVRAKNSKTELRRLKWFLN